MLVSATQAASGGNISNLPEFNPKPKPGPISNNPKSPFTIHGIHFTKNPYKVKGVTISKERSIASLLHLHVE
ncbi:hypothetical protein BDF19DRAFT_419271 [Syncephalis fuscata]|nr:hypothetical protein BDF19DRAFT_419271 [Syncephalis fuscata]